MTPLLCDRLWLPIAKRVEYKLCTLVYRRMYGSAPQYLADHVRLTSADTLMVDVPRTRLLLGDMAFCVAGPRAWNGLRL